MKTIVNFAFIVIVIWALISYWIHPTILVVAVITGLIFLMIRKRRYRVLLVSLISVIFVSFLVIMWLFYNLPQPAPPRWQEAIYTANGKYSASSKSIEYFEKLEFSPSFEITKEKLADPLYNNLLDKSKWNFEEISSETDGEDKIVSVSRTRLLHLDEKWYRPISNYSIDLPASPLGDAVLTPLNGSKIILDIPKGMIRATSPPISHKSQAIDYERIEISMGESQFDLSLTLEMLSWPWRSTLLLIISKILFWKPLMWFVGILTAVFADKLKGIISEKLWGDLATKHG